MGLFSKKKSSQSFAEEDYEPAPQSSAPVELATPSFDDPDDVTRWKMVHSANSSLATMMEKYQECLEKADTTEKAYAMGNAEFVDGVRQHELSRKNFHDMGVRSESKLERLLADLRSSTSAAREQWQNLLFLLPGSDHDVGKICNWCTTHGVDSEVMGSVLSNAILIHTDFGTTRQSFFAENDRVISLLNQAGD